MSVRGALESMTQWCSFQIKLEQDKVGAAMLTSVRKASDVHATSLSNAIVAVCSLQESSWSQLQSIDFGFGSLLNKDIK